MRLQHRATTALVAPIFLLSGLAACSSGDSVGGDSTTLVIGTEMDSSSIVDNAYSQALQLRVDQLNASGRLGNRKLKLQGQNDRSDPNTVAHDIGPLGTDKNVVALITGECDECAINSARTIDAEKLPTIALAAADEVATPVSQRHYLFKLGPNSTDSAAALVTELSRTGIGDVAILYTDDRYGQDAQRALNAELSKTTVKVKEARSIKPNATDISDAVGALAGKKTKGLVVLTGPDQAGLAATTARKAGFTGRLFFDAAAAGDQFIAPAQTPAVNGAEMVFTQTLAIDDVIATTPAKAARKQWFRDYTSRWGSYSGVAAFAADAIDLIADAVIRAGDDRGRIRDILETSQIDGLSGSIRFTPDNHSGLMPQALTMLVARSGRWRLAS